MKRVMLSIMILSLVAVGAPTFAQPEPVEAKDASPPGIGIGVGEATSCAPDAYGYMCDDTVPFVAADISGTGALVASGDDSSSGPVALGGAGVFQFYGVDLTAVNAATNGYLTSDPTDTGPDLSNDCPLPAPPSTGGGARLYPLHDDLISDIYYEYFASCPRAADRGGNQGCHVFMYDDVTHFGGGGPWQMWAILYEDTSDITYQIGPGNPETGSGSTTGVQNDAATIGQTYTCNVAGDVPDNTAVTYYNPDAVVPTTGPIGLLLFAVLLVGIGLVAVRMGRVA